MNGEFQDFIPVNYSGGPPPPELEDEASLLLEMATEPLDPSVVQAHVRKKYLIYALILSFAIGLPVAVFGVVSLEAWGLPRWMAQAAIWLVLALFFVLFFVMIALIATRGKITRYLGLRPVTRTGKSVEDSEGDSEYVALEGQRRGRLWEYGIFGRENFWRCRKPMPNFQIVFRAGAFFISPQIPAGLQALLTQIPPKRHWRGLRIIGGKEGLRTSRPARLAKYFIQDLWLAEKMAEALGQ